MFEKFSSISHKVLSYSNSEVQRIDFLIDISKILSDFFKSERIEFWLKINNDPVRFEITSYSKDSFDFNIIHETQLKNSQNFSLVQDEEGLLDICISILQDNLIDSSPFFSKKGSYYKSKTSLCFNEIKHLNSKDFEAISNANEASHSVAIIPFIHENNKVGIIILQSKEERFLCHYEIEQIEDFIQIIGIAHISQYKQAALRERVKELTCLYGMSQLSELSYVSLEEIIHRTMELLPPAWQYPEITRARVIFDNYEYSNFDYCKEINKLTAEIVINNIKRGSIEVIYTKKQYELDEGPFLKEERNLLESVAKELAFIIELGESERDKEKLQNQLQHAERLATVGELAAGVAHELNEPLGSILGFAQLAQKSEGLQKQTLDDLEKIIKSSLHAREVVKKLMFFSRQMEPKKTSVNLNNIVEDGLYFLESRCTKEGIELVRSFDPNLPDIVADSVQLNQVIVNLIVNAIQAMPNGGRLEINTFSSNKNVSLVVQDTGIGMKKKVINHIFEPFYSTKEIGQGTGLGLSVVHGIVSSHGGSIQVDSKVGNGTRFEIRFPLTNSKNTKNNDNG